MTDSPVYVYVVAQGGSDGSYGISSLIRAVCLTREEAQQILDTWPDWVTGEIHEFPITMLVKGNP